MIGRGMKRAIQFLLLALIAGGALVYGFAGRAQEQGVLANIISRVLSSPGSTVTVGDIAGALSSDASIRDITVADADGVWLKVDRVRLIWRRAALFSRRLEVERLEIGRIELSRKPRRVETEGAAAAPAGGEAPLLPELPLKVIIQAFELGEFVLGAPILGTPARLTASGSASLGNPSEGLIASLAVRRLDAVGQSVLKLSFVPQGEKLDLAFTHDEAEGGLVARLAGIPGYPPVKLDVNGNGTLDAWAGRLTFDAGPGIGASGTAQIARQGTGRKLGIDVKAQIEGLLPPIAAGIFAGTTQLTGNVAFMDGGAIGLDGFRLASQLAELTVAGRMSADRQLDVLAQARAIPGEGGATRRGAASIGRLAFEGRVTGALAQPQVEGKLDAAKLVVAEGSIDAVTAAFAATPLPADGGYGVNADLNSRGVRLANAALTRAIGGDVRLALRGTIDPKGTADLTEARIVTPNANASYVGKVGAAEVAGRFTAELARLDALSGFAGRPLEGALNLRADIVGDPPARQWATTISGQGTNLGFGDRRLDKLIGPKLTLDGKVEALRNRIAFREVRGRGAGIDARIDGDIGEGASGTRLVIAVLELADLDPRLRGRAELRGSVTGPLTNPSGTVEVSGPDIRALDRPIRNLLLRLEGRDLLTAFKGLATLAGTVDGKALAGEARMEQRPGGGWKLEPVDLRLGSVRLAGRGDIDGGGLAQGRFTLAAGNLDDLSPLILTRIGGTLDAEAVLTTEGGRQDATVKARGRALTFASVALSAVDADLSGRDLRARPVVNGQASIASLRAGGETFERITLKAAGTPQGSDLQVRAEARGFNLAADGRLIPADQPQLALASFSAVRGQNRIALARPATITFEDAGVAIDRLVLTALGGQVSVAGRAGQTLALQVEVKALPLAVAEIASPGLGLAGTLDADATISGTPAAPQGRFRANVARIATPQTRNAGLPPLDASATGTLAGDRANVDARINGGPRIALTIAGAVPIRPEGALGLAVRGTIDAGLANASLAGSGQNVTGQVRIDAQVRGTLAAPRVEGSGTLSNGSFRDPLQGVAFTNIEGRFAGAGDRITVERISAATPNGGSVTASGHVLVNPAAGFPGDVKIRAERAQLISNDIVTLVAGLDLALVGPLATAPRIAGRMDIVSLDVTVPGRLPASAEPLRGAKHIAPPPPTAARLRAIARAKQRSAARGASPFTAHLDIVVNALNRIFVRGRGIDAELGGQVRITGTTREPRALGGFELHRGRLSILTQRLDFTRGRLTFVGDVVPELDFLATTSTTGITARVAVTGPADRPTFTLSSEPSLPQDEVLSRLLFQRAASGLSAFQAVQLAGAVAELAGSGGPGMFEKTRRALGVDSLDVGMGPGGPTVGASRYISDRISVGVRAGAKPEQSAVGASFDLTRRIRLQAEAGADGRASVGIGAEIEY